MNSNQSLLTLRMGTLVCVSAVLVACGGGGDGAPASAPVTMSGATPPTVGVGVDSGTTPSTGAPPPATLPALASLPSGNCAQIASAQEALDALNQARAVGRSCGATVFPAAPALVWDSQLAQAALNHSQDMATRNFFGHTNPDGETPFDRTAKAGFGRATGENIAAGYSTLSVVMQGWLDSPGHCANIMRQSYKQYAIACVTPPSKSADFSIYWTQSFGAK
jgi:uncharacterized protein YkwD